jgi:4-hydroxy-3-methylbut-2-enyl diphosphate reductase IspH
MGNLYYKAPTDEVFAEVKAKAIEIWKTYDDTYGYATEKVDRIKDLQNIRDNFMFMVAMFDSENQTRLANLLSEEARQAISDRMVAGGQPAICNPFMEPTQRLVKAFEEEEGGEK